MLSDLSFVFPDGGGIRHDPTPQEAHKGLSQQGRHASYDVQARKGLRSATTFGAMTSSILGLTTGNLQNLVMNERALGGRSGNERIILLDFVKTLLTSFLDGCSENDRRFAGIGSGMNVLIVDDNQYDALDLCIKISACFEGASIVHSDSAEAAFTELSTRRKGYFDLIFVDQHMPGDTGTTFCERFKEDFGDRSVPVILLTSDGTDGTRAKALSCNCDGFLTKPANVKRLDSFLNGSRRHWEISELPGNLDVYRGLVNRKKYETT